MTTAAKVRAFDLKEGDVINIEYEGKKERVIVGIVETMIVVGRMTVELADPFRVRCIEFWDDTVYERAS